MPYADFNFLSKAHPYLQREIRCITPAECGQTIARVLSKFYVAGTEKSLAADKVDWFYVLQEHTAATVNAVALAWMREARRRPAPAEFLALCDEEDMRVVMLRRLRVVLTCTKPLDPVNAKDLPKEAPLLGNPIRLASLLRQARTGGHYFPELIQMDYLRTGEEPVWARPDEELRPAVEGMPTREELLAMIPVEHRAQAIGKSDTWKQFGDR
jgi:hypothetical protein